MRAFLTNDGGEHGASRVRLLEFTLGISQGLAGTGGAVDAA